MINTTHTPYAVIYDCFISRLIQGNTAFQFLFKDERAK